MFEFMIERENLELGVANTSVAIIKGVRIPSERPPAVDTFCQTALERAISFTDEELRQSHVPEGYRQIYRSLGYQDGVIKPAGLSLVEMIRKRGRYPRISIPVDLYNTVAVETLLGIGAHDGSKIAGPVVFSRAKGNERFTPLGRTSPVAVRPGDFFYRDEEKVLARLAAQDCDEAKLSPTTQQIVLVIEGHRGMSFDYVRSAIEKACDLIVQFCGGEFQITDPTTVGASPFEQEAAMENFRNQLGTSHSSVKGNA